jgi:Flp pilus assembly protein TadG
MPQRTRQRAQSMLEFALVIPLFLLLLFAMVDFSRLLFTYVSMANGARELARSVTITANDMNKVVPAFNNLTIVGGTMSGATSVTLAPTSGGGSGSITCNAASDSLCTLQVTSTPSGGEFTNAGCNLPFSNVTVGLSNVTGATGTATYTSSSFNYAFNPTGFNAAGNPTGDFVMMTWLAPDQCGLQQGFIQVCRLPFTTNCAFPANLNTQAQRSGMTTGFIQVDVDYTFNFNPLFQNQVEGVIDVSFMRPSSQVTTTVRTYAE